MLSAVHFTEVHWFVKVFRGLLAAAVQFYAREDRCVHNDRQHLTAVLGGCLLFFPLLLCVRALPFMHQHLSAVNDYLHAFVSISFTVGYTR